MQDCVGAQDFSVITLGLAVNATGGTKADAVLGGLQFFTQLPPLELTQATPRTTIPKLYFTTDPLVLSANFSPAILIEFGIRPGSTAIMFGLDTSPIQVGSTIKVSDVIAWTGLDDLTQGGFVSNTIALLSLDLPTADMTKGTTTDSSPGNRNAIWFQPQAAYKTIARLDFDVTQSEYTAIKGAFSLIGDFDVTGASLIARRSSIWNSNETGIQIHSKDLLVLTMQFNFSTYGFEVDVNLELNQNTVVLKLIIRPERKTSPASTPPAPSSAPSQPAPQPSSSSSSSKPSPDSSSEPSFTRILNWLTSELPITADELEFNQWLTNKSSEIDLGDWDVRRVVIEFNQSTGGALSFASLLLDIKLQVKCGKDMLLFRLAFKYGNGLGPSLEADLWTPPLFDVHQNDFRLLPDFEDYAYFKPFNVPNWERYPQRLDLTQLRGFESLPRQVPTLVTQAKLLITQDLIGITASIVADPAVEPSVPVVSLEEVDLAMSYQWDTKPALTKAAGGTRPPSSPKASGNTTSGDATSGGATPEPVASQSPTPKALAFTDNEDIRAICLTHAVRIYLRANPTANPEYSGAAQILGSIDYEGETGLWTMAGSVTNLWVSTLYQFFDANIQDAVAPIIQSITIDSAEVTYNY
ncbi:hypothetical protein FPANT_14200 [Fusarium pseudoanthophilum]|uniref:Uncharacterized protein n=1 Tax=Fusarium pseudoanthophilum TaxID=48495 RepID=A0A8H5JY19_9HYPO|nr:hypothetical protein FPANT_14200 [Fusarium pseudoanthophilum]